MFISEKKIPRQKGLESSKLVDLIKNSIALQRRYTFCVSGNMRCRGQMAHASTLCLVEFVGQRWRASNATQMTLLHKWRGNNCINGSAGAQARVWWAKAIFWAMQLGD